MLYERPADVVENEPEADEDRLDRLAHIDRALADEIREAEDDITQIHETLTRIEGKVDGVGKRVGALERERDNLKAQFSGAKWVLITLVGGVVLFGKELLEFIGLLRPSS